MIRTTLLILVGILAITCAKSQTYDSNFNTDTEGWNLGVWAGTETCSGQGGSLEHNTSSGENGTGCLILTATQFDCNGNGPDINKLFSLSNEKAYLISFRIKHSTETAACRLECNDYSGGYAANDFTVNSEWKTISLVFLPVVEKNYYILIRSRTTGDYYIDNFSIKEIGLPDPSVILDEDFEESTVMWKLGKWQDPNDPSSYQDGVIEHVTGIEAAPSGGAVKLTATHIDKNGNGPNLSYGAMKKISIPKGTYKLSFDVKGDGTADKIKLVLSNWNDYEIVEDFDVPNGEWKKIEIDLIISSDVSQLWLLLSCQKIGSVYFDNVKISKSVFEASTPMFQAPDYIVVPVNHQISGFSEDFSGFFVAVNDSIVTIQNTYIGEKGFTIMLELENTLDIEDTFTVSYNGTGISSIYGDPLKEYSKMPGIMPSDYYVSIDGDDSSEGSPEKPLKSLQKAIDLMQAGDICYLREGEYYGTVNIKDKKGSLGAEIVICNYPGEKVTMTGVESISSLTTGTWELHDSTKRIYKIKLTKEIWQLFWEKEELIPARWPNAQFDDGSIWDQEGTWARQGAESTFGKIYSTSQRGKDLANLNLDFSGAMAVLNLGRFMTFSREIRNHKAGQSWFNYDTDYSPQLSREQYWDAWMIGQGRFFIEAHINCLDIPKEWFYDKQTKLLYLIPPEGESPGSGKVFGKTQEFSFVCENVEGVKLKGIDFYGTTFSFNNARFCTVEDAKFDHYSFNKRMLKEADDWNGMYSTQSTFMFGPRSGSFNTIRNCEFAYTDGAAFGISGSQNTLDNILIHDIDWSGVGFITLHGAWSAKTTMKNITLYKTGASEGIQVGGQSMLENSLFGKNIGIMQKDGSCVQVSAGSQDGTVIKNNWVHSNKKFGLRADFNGIKDQKYPNGYDKGMIVHHNVAFNMLSEGESPGIHVEGDEHKVFNNTTFHNRYVRGICIAQTWAEGLANKNTIVKNNLTDPKGIGTSRNRVTENFIFIASNNLQKDVSELLVDIDNYDFRPRSSSDEIINKGVILNDQSPPFIGEAPDIGAYEYGDENYWIPGFRYDICSHPVPVNNADSIDSEFSLMWRPAYLSESFDVYFGDNEQMVSKASRYDPEYKGSQVNNIFNPPSLESGKAYFWRIDAVVGSKIYKGDTWKYTANYYPTSTINYLNNDHGIKIYPSPPSELLNIESIDRIEKIEIYSTSGVEVYGNKFDKINHVLIGVSTLPKGAYIIKVTTTTGIRSVKMVK